MFRVYLGGLLMKKIITCAVLASAALATPAFAQDEADKGMYFQLRTGVADLNHPDFAIIDTWSEPKNRLDTKLNTTSDATFCGEQIGRSECRAKVCQYVSISVVAVT